MRPAVRGYGGWLWAGLGLWSLACTQTPPWTVDRSDEQSWLLAVTELQDRLLIAGGQPGPTPSQAGTGRLLVRSDVSAGAGDYTVLDSPQPGMLWWVHALPDRGAAWLCGEQGSVLRYDGAGGGTLQVIPTSSRATLYGIWAFSDDDVWAVGGEVGGQGVILHGGRGGLTTDSSAPTTATLYKLYAASPETLFVVGQDGTLLRRLGSGASATWQRDPAPARDRMLTVWGEGGQRVFAVGGLGRARLLQFDGQAWSSDEAVAEQSGLAGVHSQGGMLLVAGQRGLLAWRRSTDPLGAPFTVAEPQTSLDLHAILGVRDTRWAVGGNLSQYPVQPPRGVVLRQGPVSLP